jgi:Protein of unknown function (DUF3611)
MLRKLRDAIRPSKGKSLARSFSRLGWAGFWLQVVFGSLPVIVMAYYFMFSRSPKDSGDGIGFVAYLTTADLLILVFTTFWSYRYTRLAKRIMDPERRPQESSVIGTVWTGVVASTVGMLFSMIVMLIESANLLFYFLKAPQAGMPVIQTSSAEAVHWVSSVDMLSLVALNLTLFAELIVLVFSLWLLFRTTLGSPEFPQTTDGPPVSP